MAEHAPAEYWMAHRLRHGERGAGSHGAVMPRGSGRRHERPRTRSGDFSRCAKLFGAMNRPFSRRDFLQQTAAVTAAAAFASSPLSAGRAGHSGHRLGLDNFAVRGMGWKAPRLVDYSASLGGTALFISDLDAFDSLDDAALAKIREQAGAKGLQ